jgi:glycosyltransferase involved in cell wall biosynthesis
MKVLHISTSSERGGAAIAARRIVEAQLKCGIDARLLVDSEEIRRAYTYQPVARIGRVIRRSVVPPIEAAISRLLRSNNQSLRSPALFSTITAREINCTDADIVNLHWTGSGMLSVYTISKIRKPIVWTLHDMWAFSGAEHYDSGSDRFVRGYHKGSRTHGDKGLDIDEFTWRLKRWLWKTPIAVASPSNWLATSARKSALFSKSRIRVVPNAIDTKAWVYRDQKLSRSILNIKDSGPVILFGALGGTKDSRKGFDLLSTALTKIAETVPNATLAVLGESGLDTNSKQSSNTVFLGELRDEVTLQLAYSAADAVVIPSRQENLPNVALEALSCGTPVVAFNIGGMSDVIAHRHNGFLADAFDVSQLADGIEWACKQGGMTQFRDQCRASLIERYDSESVGPAYKRYYDEVLGDAVRGPDS